MICFLWGRSTFSQLLDSLNDNLFIRSWSAWISADDIIRFFFLSIEKKSSLTQKWRALITKSLKAIKQRLNKFHFIRLCKNKTQICVTLKNRCFFCRSLLWQRKNKHTNEPYMLNCWVLHNSTTGFEIVGRMSLLNTWRSIFTNFWFKCCQNCIPKLTADKGTVKLFVQFNQFSKLNRARNSIS